MSEIKGSGSGVGLGLGSSEGLRNLGTDQYWAIWVDHDSGHIPRTRRFGKWPLLGFTQHLPRQVSGYGLFWTYYVLMDKPYCYAYLNVLSIIKRYQNEYFDDKPTLIMSFCPSVWSLAACLTWTPLLLRCMLKRNNASSDATPQVTWPFAKLQHFVVAILESHSNTAAAWYTRCSRDAWSAEILCLTAQTQVYCRIG